ncbi:uncharacterized protein [Halyomorpha halys]|uniref:uncharacterized protein isoform X5 n=1 Tax=Halyomorpha halys TaxID=286706 RepID=UPI0034D29891
MMLLINTLNKCFPEFLFKIYFYTWCFILIVEVFNQNNVMCMMPTTYKSQIPNSGLCVNYSQSCSHQLRNEDLNVTNETCTMIFHQKLSPVCESTNILEGKIDEKEEYGKMMLQTYLHVNENVKLGPAFNVTFYNIKWKKIYMRFIENQVKNPSLCREFQVIPEISSSFTLYFDCLWSTEIEQKAYHFEYQAFTPSGESFTYKYLFLVPNGEQIDNYKTALENWTIFMVVDVTAMPERLVLRLQVAPKHLGIRGYKVQVLKTLKEKPWIIKTEKDLYPEPGQVELTYPFETGSRFGKYMFTATPIHDNCTSNRCVTSKTPSILIEMVEPKFLTGVVMVVILVPIILMGYFIWKKNCETTKEPTTPPGPPKLLLMYSSASVQHVKAMIEIAKYLRVCGVNALIDELGIPESIHKDPLRWYIEAFNQADYVAIFASPNTTPGEQIEARRYSRYQHREQIAQNQLAHRLISTDTRCKFFSVAMPGTNYDTLPAEAAALRRYLFPRDLDPVLVLVGSACQCDHGAGFLHALELAAKVEEVEPPLPTPIHPPPKAEPTPHAEDEEDGRAPSPCCNTQSASDMDLVSSKQYQSDTDDSDQSMDHFSFLVLVGNSDTLWRQNFMSYSFTKRSRSQPKTKLYVILQLERSLQTVLPNADDIGFGRKFCLVC